MYDQVSILPHELGWTQTCLPSLKKRGHFLYRQCKGGCREIKVDTVYKPGNIEVASEHQELRDTWGWLSIRVPSRILPANAWVTQLGEDTCRLLEANQFVSICYSNPGAPILGCTLVYTMNSFFFSTYTFHVQKPMIPCKHPDCPVPKHVNCSCFVKPLGSYR